MTNPNDPIAPCKIERPLNPRTGFTDYSYPDFTNGLTKREYFAAMAMQGILAFPGKMGPGESAPSLAVKFSDALISELNKGKKS